MTIRTETRFTTNGVIAVMITLMVREKIYIMINSKKSKSNDERIRV